MAEPRPSASTTVQVTLLLTGGHQFTLSMERQDPLLKRLFEATLSSNGKWAGEIFQLPLEQGRSMLTIRGDRLVGLVTNPPLRVGLSNEPPAPPPYSYVLLNNVLSPADRQELLDFTLQQEAYFVPTTTSTNAENYRRSLVLHSFPRYSDWIIRYIESVMPQVLETLGITPFPVSQIEAQLTAHNDGNFYKIHNDNGSAETATRELTYVYYFFREPKAFTGGELVLYPTILRFPEEIGKSAPITIEPRNNSLILFPSRFMHEVLPVQCPSRAFADSRFTINGWVRH